MSRFAHVDPVRGAVCLYSPEVQQRLMHELTAPTCSVYLGALCFNATVHKDRQTYWQTTPAIRNVKPGGRREVIHVPASQPEVTLYKTIHGKWVATRPASSLESMPVPITGNGTFKWVWQWCVQLQWSGHDSDWYTYEASTCADIETAWTHADGEFSVPITVGIRNYEIRGNKAHTFYKQVDAQHGKVRFVRRVALPTQHADREVRDDGDCAMCCEPLVAGSASLPTWRPWSCQHEFHSVCIQLVVDAAQSCPLCRCDHRV